MNQVRGKVKWFKDEKGFGFITREDGKGDVFVHYTGISGPGNDRKTLKEGELVEFDVQDSDKGPKAINVAIL